MTSSIFKLDHKKALEVLLYVLHKKQNLYTALKMLYFADKIHLQRYGRLVYGETYSAMRNGPVPSFAYDLIKSVRGDGFINHPLSVDQAIEVDENTITPIRKPEMVFLSETDVECLNEAIAKYGSLSFGELKRLSHDKAFDSANENDSISLNDMIDSLDNAEDLKLYLYG